MFGEGGLGGGSIFLSRFLPPSPVLCSPLPTHPPPLLSPPLLSPLFPSTTSLSLPLSLSPSFCFAMPSLVVSGIMERNGGFGELGCFGGSAKDRGLLEDERALQLALDQLCLLGLGEPPAPTAGEDGGGGGGGAPAQPAAPPQPAQPPPPAAPPAAPTAAPAAQTPQPPTAPKGASDAKLCALYKEAELRLKGSSNTTECVPVPTSEHVAEIVGRQGKRAPGPWRETGVGGTPSLARKVHFLPPCPPLAWSLPHKGGPAPYPDFQVPQSSRLPPSWDCSPDPSSPQGCALRQRNILRWREGKGRGIGLPIRGGCPEGVSTPSRKNWQNVQRVTPRPLLRHLLVGWGGGTPGTPSRLELQTLGETWPGKPD